MKKYIIIITCLLLISIASVAQRVITLESCHQKAKENYPLIKRYELIEKSKGYNLSNASKGYLPQISLSAKATYQSEVTKIPVEIPGMNIKGLSRDQYSATIDVNQTIWDGGVINSQKDMANASAKADTKQMNVELYTINDRVNQLFFGILLMDTKLKQNDLLQEELQRNHNLISSYIANGIANQADLDAIKVEQLKAVQNKTQLKSNKQSYIDMLSILIGDPINENDIIQKPKDEITSSEINRPELDMYDAQINNLEVQRKMIKAGYMPKLGVFVTGGYGKPGLNMLENEFSPYYIAGIRLTWNFGSLYTKKNDQRLIDVNQNSIKAQRETFLFNTGMDISQKQNDIQKNRDLLKYDDEIISLRNNVKKATEVKVANGIKTVTDLMNDVNSEDLAKQDKIQHEIELLLSIYNFKYTTNN